MTIPLRRGVALGPFDLLEPIGQGGMAEVWAGVHRSSNEAVAVKILTDEATRRHEWIVAFRNEIRAVAGLTHPAIVHVDDYGEIPEDVGLEGELGDRLRPGCPYLVMERVPGGSVRDRLGRLRWDEIRFILMRLLDALAHAHARGLVHRDITPGNVLGSGSVLKLADFGLCHWIDQATGGRDRATTAGTPAYMAPEQWMGRWRDFGPWTDMYGVGCLAWALATGEPPFGTANIDRIRTSHLNEGPPGFEPTIEVPDGFEEMLRSCLRKDPGRRLQRAADMLWQLLDLRAPAVVEFVPPDEDQLATQNMAALSTMWSVVLPSAFVEPASLKEAMITGERGAPIGVSVRVPRSWRGPMPDPERRLLPGVGLSLMGFRTVPLVGREDEQNALWQALLEVVTTRRPRLVTLRGGAGTGKSRLARWLAERAHEVGAATVLEAGHGPGAVGADPLVEMVRTTLRVRRGDSSELLTSRVRKHLRDHGVDDPFEATGLSQLLAPRIGAANDVLSGGFAVGPVAPAERRAMVHRAVDRLAMRRPVVLVLEDVHYGAESLRLVSELLDARDPAAVLVLATARDDIVAERPEEAELLSGLEAREAARSLAVGPLERAHWGELVRRILHLEEGVAVQVEERAAGNPLFAIQLVADWVQRGYLELGVAGFRLREGTDPLLPDDLHQIWDDRISDLLESLPTTDGEALELAAVLGERIDREEWAAAAAGLGVEPSAELLEQLLAQRLARVVSDHDDSVWAFAHAMLRESLERRVVDGGRAPRFHGACARMLGEREGPGYAERRGRHLLLAGELEGALEPLLAGASERADLGDFRQAEALVARREVAMEDLDVAEDDPRWGEGLVLLAGLEVERNRLDKAAELAEQLRRRAGRAQWRAMDGWARQLLGRISTLRGELSEALEHLEAATQLAEERIDPHLFAACRAAIGMVLLLDGRYESAREATVHARREFSAHGLQHGAAAMTLQLSLIALQEGELAEATRFAEEARARFEDLGARNSVAQCITQQGAIAHANAQPGDARRLFEQALALYRALGAGGYLAPLVKLGVLSIEAGEYDEGRELLDEAVAGLEEIGGWNSIGALQVLMLPAVAAAGDWEAWDRLVPEAEVVLASGGVLHPDIPRLARMGGDLAVKAGHHDRARRIWLLALGQWRRLGHLAEARTLAADLAALSRPGTNGDIQVEEDRGV